ncbi:hypothetical protein ACJQWK_02779 [Exserohilum turcicum]
MPHRHPASLDLRPRPACTRARARRQRCAPPRLAASQPAIHVHTYILTYIHTHGHATSPAPSCTIPIQPPRVAGKGALSDSDSGTYPTNVKVCR